MTFVDTKMQERWFGHKMVFTSNCHWYFTQVNAIAKIFRRVFVSAFVVVVVAVASECFLFFSGFVFFFRLNVFASLLCVFTLEYSFRAASDIVYLFIYSFIYSSTFFFIVYTHTHSHTHVTNMSLLFFFFFFGFSFLQLLSVSLLSWFGFFLGWFRFAIPF